MESTTSPPWEDDECEVCNDAGFIYKRHKRLSSDLPPERHSDPDPAAGRRKRKRKALLKLRDQYRKEMEQWEYLSSTLLAMEETESQLRLQRGQTTSSPSLVVPAVESVCASVVDDLLVQVEAQEAIIKQASNLCDIAEAMCNVQEEEEYQALIDLPIWALPASPRKLLASLCDPEGEQIVPTCSEPCSIV